MGAKVPCESRWCNNEAELICKCQGVKLCYNCVGPHMREQTQYRHDVIQIRDLRGDNYSSTPSRITINNIKFLRFLYKSPEGATEVHEGEIRGIGKVAIKVMFCRNDAELQKKKQEADLHAALSHPNICQYYTSFLDENFQSGYKFVIVMEYSENGDLEHEIEVRKMKRDYWQEGEILRHMTELIDAFGYMQDNNMIHGDIKPRNLFIAQDGHLKIGDFGASMKGVEALVTKTYHVTGTVVYFSPLLYQAYREIINGRNVAGEIRHNPNKSDVYSLGLSFLHMCTLDKPVDMNFMEQGYDYLQREVEKKIRRLPYSLTIQKILGHMLQVVEPRRYDFKQLRTYLKDKIFSAMSIQHALSFPMRKDSMNNSESWISSCDVSMNEGHGPVILSLPQIPGTMYTFDVDRFKVSEINYHRIQPSCRIALMSKEIFITGGLKTPKQSFAVNRKTKEGRRLADLCKGRAFHSILFHKDSLYILGGRSSDKRTALQSCEVWDNEEWKLISQLNEGRENATAISFNEEIYIVGGSKRQRNKWIHLDCIEKFTNEQWELLNFRFEFGLSGVGLLPYDNDNFMIVGGSRDREGFSTEVYTFNVNTQQIQQTSDLPEGDAFWSHQYYVDEFRSFLVGTMNGIFKYTRHQDVWDLEFRY